MAHIHITKLINAPMDQVLAFSRDPNHWDEWFVGLREPDQLSGDGGPGTVVKHQYRMAAMNFPLTTTIVEQNAGPKQALNKLKFEGTFTGTQTWSYKAMDDRTEVTADIDYTIPGSALGRIADRLLVERLQEKAMEHTLENLKMMTEANVSAAAVR